MTIMTTTEMALCDSLQALTETVTILVERVTEIQARLATLENQPVPGSPGPSYPIGVSVPSSGEMTPIPPAQWVATSDGWRPL